MFNIGGNNTPSFEEKKMNLDAGLLGKIFGNSSSAPSNIAGISILILLGFSVYVNQTNIWSTTSPIITLILGYLFGKQTS